MNRCFLLSALAFASATACAHTNAWSLVGSVAEPCVVSAALHPFLYRYATAGEADALEKELRIHDGHGRPVAYAIRPKVARTARMERTWQRLSLKSLTETNGQLIIEAEYPFGATPPARFVALKVDTPLHDFEQQVTVSADGVTVAKGVFCDYRKFADLRKVEMPLEMTSRRTLLVTFSKPVSASESAAFERTVTERVKDGAVARTVRRSVVDRPFRIDGLSVAVPKEAVLFEPAPPDRISFSANACGRKVEAKAKRTVFNICTAFMPVTGIRLNIEDGNFSRRVRVMRRVRSGWMTVKEGKVRSVHLPGAKMKSLELTLPGECREDYLRIEVDDMDDPPVSYGDLPVTVLVKPYELAFIASPGEAYSVAIEKGAERPCYDSSIFKNAALTKDPATWRIELPKTWNDGILNDDGPTAVWMASLPDPVTIVSAFVFVVLSVLCFYLFRRSR